MASMSPKSDLIVSRSFASIVKDKLTVGSMQEPNPMPQQIPAPKKQA
jgi:hypothetical protein